MIDQVKCMYTYIEDILLLLICRERSTIGAKPHLPPSHLCFEPPFVSPFHPGMSSLFAFRKLYYHIEVITSTS